MVFVVVCGGLEAALRDDLPQPVLLLVVTVGLAPLLLWRRTHPLAVVAMAFGVVAVVDIGLIVGDAAALDGHTMLYVILLPYALFRWGSGREAAAGLAIVLVPATLALVGSSTGVAAAIGRFGVLVSAFALGWAVRSQHDAGERWLEQVKSQERVLLARGLHDTVAYHVSAIAVQPRQAARSRPPIRRHHSRR